MADPKTNKEEKGPSKAEIERADAIKARVSAGLSKEQAIEVQNAQEANDKAVKAAEKKSED